LFHIGDLAWTRVPPCHLHIAYRLPSQVTFPAVISGIRVSMAAESPALSSIHSAREDHQRFYILREAELNGGRLTGVGGRIVTEVLHRAMEGSRASIVKDSGWRPTLSPDSSTFRMTDLLLFAFENNKELLAPLG